MEEDSHPLSLIHQNPYRVLGLLAGCSEKEIAKQRSRVKAYLDVGKEVSFDGELDLGGPPPDRSQEAIEKAFSEIEHGEGKLFHGLFWFIQRDHVDEVALEQLRDGDYEKASSMWVKRLGSEITPKTISSIHNLGTLYLYKGALNGKIEILKEGLRFKTEVLLSGQEESLLKEIGGETVHLDGHALFKDLVERTFFELSKKFDSKLPDLLSAHSELEKEGKEYLGKGKAENIEAAVKKTAKKRKEEPSKGVLLGWKLVTSQSGTLRELKRLLGEEELSFQNATDELADEVLQCGIDAFLHFKEEEQEYEKAWERGFDEPELIFTKIKAFEVQKPENPDAKPFEKPFAITENNLRIPMIHSIEEFKEITQGLSKQEIFQKIRIRYGKFGRFAFISQDQEESKEPTSVLKGDLGEDVEYLFNCSLEYAIGDKTKNRIEENLKGIRDWNNREEERKKESQLKEELRKLNEWVDQCRKNELYNPSENEDESVRIVNQGLALLNIVEENLIDKEIEKKLGFNDDFFVQLSDLISNEALNKAIEGVNEQQNTIKEYNERERSGLNNKNSYLGFEVLLSNLNQCILQSKTIIYKINKMNFNLSEETKSRIQKNKETLDSLSKTIGSGNKKSTTSDDDQSNIGCIIIAIIAFIVFLAIVNS